MANRILDWVARLDGWLLCTVTFVLAFGESAAGVDLIVPGEVGMVVAGAAAHRAGVPLWVLVLVAAVGAIAGDQLSYQIGRRYGLALIDRWSWLSRRLRPKVESARRHFAERGAVTVALSRWVGALRAVVPLVAGMAEMPPARFLVWNAVGAVTWSATVVTLGYVLGRAIADVVDRFSLLFSVVVVAGFVLWWAVRFVRRHR